MKLGGGGNYDSFNWKQALFGERIPKKFSKKKNQNLTLSMWYYALDHFGLSATTKCSIMDNGMNLRSNIGSGMS